MGPVSQDSGSHARAMRPVRGSNGGDAAPCTLYRGTRKNGDETVTIDNSWIIGKQG